MTLNDLERQNKGFYKFFWRFQAATQVNIIHKVAPRFSRIVMRSRLRIWYLYINLASHAALDRQRWAAIVTMASDTNGH